MLRLYGEFFMDLGTCPQVWPTLNSGHEPSDNMKSAWFSSVKHIMAESARLEMPATHAQCKTIERSVTEGTVSTMQEHGRQLVDLWSRALDELNARFMLMLTLDEAKHYEIPTKGWESVLKAFPSTESDIEEANRCYAVGRSTACVFHLMRAMESPLKALASTLGIVKHSPTWEAYLSKMTSQIQLMFPDKTKAHAEKREYFTALEGHIRAIKSGWRNPTMHDLAKMYTPEMAQELLVHVRAFMRHAAIELSE
jgi:hypothetical protein